MHEFGKVGDGKKGKGGASSEEGVDSVEVQSREKPGAKKRIKKVRKVLRNSAARNAKNLRRDKFSDKGGSAEVKSLLPTVTTQRTTTAATRTTARATTRCRCYETFYGRKLRL